MLPASESNVMRTMIAASFLWLTAFAVVAAEPEVPTGAKSRKFEFTYAVNLKAVPEGAKIVDLWIPIPQSDKYQEISNVKFHCEGKAQIPEPEVGIEPNQKNKMAHWKLSSADLAGTKIEMSFECTRKEIATGDLSKSRQLTDEEKKAYADYLKANKLVLVGDEIAAVADEATKGANTPAEVLKCAYDYTVSNMKYDKPADKLGWGQGSTKWACDSKFGNCTDFHALIMSIGRTKGLPVKFEIGFPLPEPVEGKPETKDGPIGGYHCWAKLFLADIGWVPVDASEAQKHPEKKNYFCGNLCPNRVQFTTGRDVDLVPKQAGAALNYFIYPYAEADGKAFPVDKAFKFKDL
jgi:hypothetical protein